jgi:hypothetical protein
MKPFHYFTALLISLSLFGCKPKEATLTGQVFIVTRGADSIKLGLVEVQLIERTSVEDFIQKKQSAIDAETKSIEEEIAFYQHDYDLYTENMTRTNMMLVSSSDTNLDETHYVALLKEKENLTASLETNKEFKATFTDFLQNPNRYPHAQIEKINEKFLELQKTESDTQDKIQLLNARIDSITHNMEGKKAKLEDAQVRLNAVHKNPEYYLEHFSPSVIQKTLTDADGKFLLSCPRDKTFSLFAKAERFAGDTEETYYWLVNAPSGIETAQIFLSNNNLVTVDPDGYFKTKPKSELQEFAP